MPPVPAMTRTARGLSGASRPPAAAMPTDAAPNSMPEYRAKTRPEMAAGTRWFRKLRVVTTSTPLARPPIP